MSDTDQTTAVLTTQDGVPLKVSIRRALRAQKIRALLLVAPLFLFILLSFVAPIADMLFRSVENDIVPNTLPKTVVAIELWDENSGELPGEDVYAALAADLQVATKFKTHTRVGSRLNYEKPGASSLFRKTGRRVNKFEDGNYKEQFLKADKKWGDVEYWQVIKRFSSPLTAGYFLAASDAERNADGVQLKAEDERIYLCCSAEH